MSDAKSMTIGKVMTKSVISVDASMTINEAAKMMEDTKVGAVIVMENNTPVGIVTERDFVTKVAAEGRPLFTEISEIMSSPLITIDPEETVWEASETMKEKLIHKLPVIENDKAIGIITTSDIVRISSVGSDSQMRRICDQILMRMKDE